MRWPRLMLGTKAAILLVIGVMCALVLSVFWQGSTAVVSQFQNRVVVMLDPGHGGYDPGAISAQGIYEKEINLKIAQKVKEMLIPSGIEVFMTREEDLDYVPSGVKGKTTKKQIDLNHRIEMAKEENADIFVSLHVNATKSGNNSGAETFYHYKSEPGKRLAELIQQEMIKITGMNRRIAKPGDFYVIKNTSMPAVIVEVGYLSSSKEQKKLQQSWYQEQLARAIAKGIANYFLLP
ncbi:N-acetylmuramoyl-L-alanine amidase [Desulfosporosinus orientis DSM 765]|uniref:N-acetylmuramoyl-L-alanine amidase n=1 Tax=Desulfosporosinus orientis (strain ATCC 19365 / DSM 765 / NCIMB 8382 / VKM B-1628 / Singapore I) TaxID=768706 RepID=G7W7D0_DESOD|nr:N-acetylmuramoyl-L-alanine amidase [Desulfosporosinus orientis]AET65801.1 N-acetylmuramoyl-L-alanine amidase [Desulfosporosinus orientis DSM 765]